MSTYTTRLRPSGSSRPALDSLGQSIRGLRLRRGTIFGAIITVALISFELFNFSTTEFALADLLGSLGFAGVAWSTILALAFCGMDFAGIARLLTPESGEDQPMEAWYMLGAWFLAATMNAMLTWWAVSLALINHQGLGNEVMGRETLLQTVPVFVAMLVWLIRILMIGAFTLAGPRLFSHGSNRTPLQSLRPQPQRTSVNIPERTDSKASRPIRPMPKPSRANTAQPQSMAARPPRR